MSLNENEIYINIIKNIDLIKHKLNTIKDYTEKNDSSKSIEYIEKLHKFSMDSQLLLATVEDVYDEYILNANNNILCNEDIIKRKNIEISNKVHKLFLPYMLYMTVILQNNIRS